jgi:hypothetical protein
VRTTIGAIADDLYRAGYQAGIEAAQETVEREFKAQTFKEPADLASFMEGVTHAIEVGKAAIAALRDERAGETQEVNRDQ